MTWRDLLGELFAAPPARPGRTLPARARFDLGVCPGCKGLRVATSTCCDRCGSTVAIAADA